MVSHAMTVGSVVGGSVIGASVTTGVAVPGAEESTTESAESDPPPQLTATAMNAAPTNTRAIPLPDLSDLPRSGSSGGMNDQELVVHATSSTRGQRTSGR
ncbi:MAG: hypothetical protein ACK49V_08780, partial [Actinomycetes bacterium]